MFKKILYPTDFSDCCAHAFEYVKRLKGAGTEEVVLLHVLDERELEMIGEGVAWAGKDVEQFLRETREKLKEKAKGRLEGLKGELEEQGLRVRVEIKEGIPFREIIEVADEEGVSLIVIGSHGKSMVREMLLGSVSEKVARKAKQPVLIVKGVKPK